MSSDATLAAKGVRFFGINGAGHESANARATSGRSMPWLQDVASTGVQEAWGRAYRDVVILDGQNRVVDAYNVTKNDLKDASNYAALRGKIEAAVAASR